jgi:excisionase family DNA binding protein
MRKHADSRAGLDRHAMGPPEERLLPRGEAARYLDVPVSTIYGWAKSGRLRHTATLGGHLRFARSDLDAAKAGSHAVSELSLGTRLAPDPPGTGPA